MQVIVKLTNQCNLRCRYCSEGDSETNHYLSEEIWKKLVDELPELMAFKNDEKINILWHGGEPLIFPKQKLCKFMDYAKEKLQNYKLEFSMQTNGYAIDDEWMDIFRQYDIAVGMSLDGYKALHDAGRRTALGEGSYDKVVVNLKKLQSVGMEVGTLMVLDTAEAIDVEKLFACIIECGGDIKIHPVIPCGRAYGKDNMDELNQNYFRLMQDLFVRCVQTEEEIAISPLKELLEAIIADNDISECSFSGDCGDSFICIYSDGAVGVCGRRLPNKTYEYGSLYENSLLDLYKSDLARQIRARGDYLQEHDCKECKYWKWCHGGCTFEAVNTTGKIYASYAGCEYRKQLIDYLIEKGMPMLKEKLIQQRKLYRQVINSKKRMLQDIENA